MRLGARPLRARPTARRERGVGCRTAGVMRKLKLLRLLLLLLTDADLGVQRLGIGERLVIVACHRLRQVLLDIGALRQDGHHRVAIIAGRAEGPEPLNIRNCHNFYSLTRRRDTEVDEHEAPIRAATVRERLPATHLANCLLYTSPSPRDG